MKRLLSLPILVTIMGWLALLYHQPTAAAIYICFGLWLARQEEGR